MNISNVPTYYVRQAAEFLTREETTRLSRTSRSLYWTLKDCVTVELPTQLEHLLNETLFFLHRRIENQYRLLPWPPSMQNIMVFTQVSGGKGDIAGAAKAIALMQKIYPTLSFDWALTNGAIRLNPSSFLTGCDPSTIQIRDCRALSEDQEQVDLVVLGPFQTRWGGDFNAERSGRKISGPVFCFAENASTATSFPPEALQYGVQKAPPDESADQTYHKYHTLFFPNKSRGGDGTLPMGLQPGSGILLDQSRIQAPLSRGYCCPSYLLQIQDKELRKDILYAMGRADRRSLPDYDRFSFNSGYAHHPVSWGKFIDCVALHEQDKSVVIVLNCHGEFEKLSAQDFCLQVLTVERQVLLRQKGYGKIVCKGQDTEPVTLGQVDSGHGKRELTVIVRASFAPADMRNMQLASERLLATGDNSAAEAWCARCKLYLYEDVANLNCKWRFLQQQVDLAKTISPTLAQLLALFGGDRRLAKDSLNKPLDKEQMEELEQLLRDPTLGRATLQFCEHIVSHYSFNEVFEGGLKRTVWHHLIPELAAIEAFYLGQEFRSGLIAYLKDPEHCVKKTLTVRTLPQLRNRVQEVVQQAMLRMPPLKKRLPIISKRAQTIKERSSCSSGCYPPSCIVS